MVMTMLAAVLAGMVVDFGAAVGPVKPVNGVGQPPMIGSHVTWDLMPRLYEAGIPYSRLHDVGGWLGGGLYVDVPCLFPNFDADETGRSEKCLNFECLNDFAQSTKHEARI